MASLEMIARATKLRPLSKEPQEKFLERITNLSLHSKRLNSMANLDVCPNLRILFLYNNQIARIENLSFATSLIHLYLENNQITEIEQLNGLRHLTKLFLDGNMISRLQGLEDCTSLEEVHLSNQRLPDGECFSFDEDVLDRLSESLVTLTLNNSHVSSVAPLRLLVNLHVLRCNENQIEYLEEIEQIIIACNLLQEIDFSSNPASAVPGYRDCLIENSELLQVIDDRAVKPNQRAFLHARSSRRKNSSHSRVSGGINSKAFSFGAGGQLSTRKTTTAKFMKRSSTFHERPIETNSALSGFLNVGSVNINRFNQKHF